MPSGSDFKYSTGDTTAWKSKYYAFVDYALSVGASVADIEAFLAENSSFAPGTAPTTLDTARDCLTAGSATTYTATFTPAFTSLVNGIELKVRWHTDNGENPTFDLDGLGARAIVRPDGGVPEPSALKANYTGKVVYNTTLDKWVLVSNIPQDPPAAPTLQVFTGSGTYNAPPGSRKIIIEVQAAGGGGGRGNSSAAGKGSGGGGGWSRKVMDVSAGSYSASYVVGTGGSGSSGGGDGTAGGSSTWSDGSVTITCTGGSGGFHNGSGAEGGDGGSATGGDENVAGQKGSQDTGGWSVSGWGGNRSDYASQRDGVLGGGGAGAGQNQDASGDGGDGEIRVMEFY